MKIWKCDGMIFREVVVFLVFVVMDSNCFCGRLRLVMMMILRWFRVRIVLSLLMCFKSGCRGFVILGEVVVFVIILMILYGWSWF